MKQIPFRIVNIIVEEFQLFTDAKIGHSRVDVRTDFEFGVNRDAHAVSSKIKYTYFQNELPLMQLTLICVFDVKPDEFGALIVEDKFVIEPFFSQYLATINVGAARGEIHARCDAVGSPVANIILPPINLTEPLSDTIEIQLG